MTDTTRLSNRQFTMLQMFYSESKDFLMKVDVARAFDQRAFRSMLIRKYVSYVPSANAFRLTAEGRAAFHTFEATDITRRNPTLPLTAYFDANILGLHRMKARRRAA
jgi:hypothetical protein